MGRKNRRSESFVPLDLTPADVVTSRRGESDHQQRERQAAARVNRAIDWSVCIVPGCGRSLVMWNVLRHRPGRRDSTLELPICYNHAAVVWNDLVRFHTERSEFIDAIADVNERLAARTTREAIESKAERLAQTDGDIYFIRLGGMVKVGWTRDIWQRVKSYGASAEVLACYPATRDDETNLHRQLRPVLAKGREWYDDGPVVQAFIEEAFVKFGACVPDFTDMWTQPKQVVAGKRARRG